MISKWKMTTAAAALIAAAAFAPAEQPQQGGPAQGMRRPMQQMRGEEAGPGGAVQKPGQEMILKAIMQSPEFAKSVGLTDEQVKAVKDAAFAYRQSMVKARSDAELARLEVEKLQDADKPDEAALMKAIDDAGAKETAIRKAQAAFELKVKGLIGTEAQQKIRERIQARMERAREDGPAMRRNEGDGGQPQRAPWMRDRMEQQGEKAPSRPAPDA